MKLAEMPSRSLLELLMEHLSSSLRNKTTGYIVPPLTMRLFSTILFALMAMVLPMAGVQHYFCTMSMAFVDGTGECPVEKKECCGEKHKPEKPDCMVSTKLLPNAEKSSPVQIPVASVLSILPVYSVELVPGIRIETLSPEKDRGSAGSSPAVSGAAPSADLKESV